MSGPGTAEIRAGGTTEGNEQPDSAGNDGFPAWTALAVTTDQVDPFACSPAWQIPFHRAFNPARRLVIESSGDAVLAFAQITASDGRFMLFPIEMHWNFGCPLLGDGAVERLAELDARARGRAGGAFRGMVISGLRPRGGMVRRLRKQFGERLVRGPGGGNVQCSASLAGGFDGYLSRRTAHERKNLRRESRRAVEHGVAFERVCPQSPGEARRVYARMAAVERRSWKGLGHCGMTEPGVDAFYSGMLEWLSHTGEARVVFARHQDQDIGFIFGGMAGGIYRGQQFSFDDAWKARSIGNLLQLEQITWLCDQGAERYDMGPSRGPSMAYKRHWTETEQSMTTWRILPSP
jgi:CelD/BcsL family acetyltransferase involved in cellulose biosynthesis